MITAKLRSNSGALMGVVAFSEADKKDMAGDDGVVLELRQGWLSGAEALIIVFAESPEELRRLLHKRGVTVDG